MENLMIENAIQHGLWATLFVGLFIWTMREHSRREKGYKEIIHELTEKFGAIDESIKALAAKLDRRDYK